MFNEFYTINLKRLDLEKKLVKKLEGLNYPPQKLTITGNKILII